MCDIELFRMTHIDNIPHILKYGITHKYSALANSNYRSIGDTSLIKTRDNKIIPITNGLNKVIKEITLGNYIPFYFGVKMPMLFVIQNGGNLVEKVPAQDIIYIVCQLKELINLKNEFYFSDGHATDNFTTFYNRDMISDIVSILDWEAINQTYWGGEGNLELKRKKQAEFLIEGDLPFSFVKRLICYNEEVKNKLVNWGIQNTMIEISKDAYY